MADFYFFTDIDKLKAQTPAQAFGPISVDKYNIKDAHTSTSDPNAYAITDGIICVQKQDGNTGLVNIILKPFYQPLNTPPVKYYVYRDILLSSLNDSSDATEPEKLAPSIENTLVSEIHKDTGIDPKSVLILGLSLDSANNFTDTDPIDKLFFKNTNASFQLYVVRGGWSIGKFNTSGFSFEIHLDNIGFNPDLGFIRRHTGAGVLDVSNSSNASLSHIHDFEKQCAREALLNFIDPVCFFGSIKNNSGDRLFVNNANAPSITTKNDFSDKTNSLFSDFLVLGKFNNKNHIYIDIRDEYNNSFDYQRRYGQLNASDNIYNRKRLKIFSNNFQSPSSPTDIDYYREFNWPLLRLFRDTVNTYIVNPNTVSNTPSIVLSIVLPVGINIKPLLYFSYTIGSQRGNLFDTLQMPRPDAGDASYLDPVLINIPIDSGNNLISSYHQIKYIFEQIQVNEPSSTNPEYSIATSILNDTSLNGLEPLDNVFQPFILKQRNNSVTLEETFYIPWEDKPAHSPGTPPPLLTNVYYDKTIIDTTRYSNSVISASKGIGVTNNNVINLFCHANENNRSNNPLIPDISPILNAPQNLGSPPDTLPSSHPFSFLRYIYEYSKSFQKSRNVLGLNALAYSYADLVNPVKKIERLDTTNQRAAPNTFSDFMNIDISKNDWNAIKTKASSGEFLKNSKIFLGLKFVDQNVTQGVLEGGTAIQIRYIRYELILRGYIVAPAALNKKIKLTEIDNLGVGDIPVYYYYAINELVREDFDKIQTRGKRHRINILSINETSDYTGFDIKEKHTIEAELFLIRGAHVSTQEYVKYLNYFKHNIRKIWTSATKTTDTFGNKGLVGLEVPGTQFSKKIRVSVDPDTDNNIKGVEFKQSNILCYRWLINRQSFVYITKSSFNRSFFSGNNLIYMIYNDRSSTKTYYTDNVSNAPAHEFGHLLGLHDRYTYLALSKFPADNIDTGNAADLYSSKLSNKKNQFKVNPFYGRNTPLFLPKSFDNEYGTDYGWHHNLMSTLNIVPDFDKLSSNPNRVDLDSELDYIQFFDRPFYKPGNFVNKNNDYDVVCIFVTNTQWSYIFENKSENSSFFEKNLFRYHQGVFFKHVDEVENYPTKPANFYRGSFAGVLFTENDLAAINANPNFNPDLNPLNDITPGKHIHSYFKSLDNYYGTNDTNGKYPYAIVSDDGFSVNGTSTGELRDIEKRILKPGGGKFLNNIKAYVNPSSVSTHVLPRPPALALYLNRFEPNKDSNAELNISELDKYELLRELEMGNKRNGVIFRAIREREDPNKSIKQIIIKPWVANPSPGFIGFGPLYFVDEREVKATQQYILNGDAYSKIGDCGGKIIEWEANVIERTIVNDSDPYIVKDVIFKSPQLYNSGRLLWNYFEEIDSNPPIYSNYKTTNSNNANMNQLIVWNAYTNRNIILYLIANAIMDFQGNTNIFRNHTGFTYMGIKDFNGDGSLEGENE